MLLVSSGRDVTQRKNRLHRLQETVFRSRFLEKSGVDFFLITFTDADVGAAKFPGTGIGLDRLNVFYELLVLGTNRACYSMDFL